MDKLNKDHPPPKTHEEIAGNTGNEIKPDLEKLRIYKQFKLELAAQLRIVREGLKALGRKNAEQQCEELMVKLAEDRFILAVLGQFKRGKSSLMNAIIGEDILPTGVLPLTSAITVLKYGPAKRIVVNRKGYIFPEELPVSSLPDFVTEKGNPGNQKNVKDVSVELPVPFLRSGIEFVDTPGVGSAFKANTATTYSFLPECDAVLFVTSVDTPMTSLELEFLKEIREYVNRIFFVVNKIDLVTDSERDEVLGFVTGTIRAQTGSDDLKIFPVSSRLGLNARISGDTTTYQKSGLKALEDALATFLSKEKSAIFLAAVAQKLVRILDAEMAEGVFEESALQSRAEAIKNQKPVTIHTDPHSAALGIHEVRAKLEILYKGILIGKITALSDIEIKSPVATENILTGSTLGVNQSPIPVPTSAAAITDLAADLQSGSCPVCRRITKEVMDFFAHWQYQLSAEEKAQDEFAAELGFCPLHTWQLLAMSSPYGMAVGYARLIEHIAHKLREQNTPTAKGYLVGGMVRNSKNCRVCEFQRRVQNEYISKLAKMISESDGHSLYRNSQGACLRHLEMLLNSVTSKESRSFLLAHASGSFEMDAEDMRNYALKRDALRRNLLYSNEEDAYLRSIIRFVGSRSVCMPWADDGEI